MKHVTCSIPIGSAIMFILVATGALAQKSAPPTGGLELLQSASRHYANAKSYHIQMVEEESTRSEFQRGWTKAILEAAQSADKRFRHEGRTGWGTELQLSDGFHVWTYNVNDNIYTETPVAPDAAGMPTQQGVGLLESQTVMRAKNLRDEMAHLSNHYKSAARLPDQTIAIDGRSVSCYVVRVELADAKRSYDESYEETFWIDKEHSIFVQKESHRHRTTWAGDMHSSQDIDTTTTYPVNVIDGELPDALFKFVPPATARKVDEFPNPAEGGVGPSLKGQMLPDLILSDPEGKPVPSSSFRGKVVLVEIWATWCAPCVKGLEQLSKMYSENRDKGLVVITVDQDEEAATAQELLKKNKYAWTNVHDDGSITKALRGGDAVPRTLIVNRDGRVVYDSVSGTEETIRGVLASIAPEFARTQ